MNQSLTVRLVSSAAPYGEFLDDLSAFWLLRPGGFSRSNRRQPTAGVWLTGMGPLGREVLSPTEPTGIPVNACPIRRTADAVR